MTTGLKTIYLAVAALLTIGVLSAKPDGKKPYRGTIEITPITMQHRGDSLYIAIRYRFDSVKTVSRRSIRLIPTLVGKDNRRELPEIAVRGRADYLQSRRKVALMRARDRAGYAETHHAVIKGFGKEQITAFEYRMAILYEPWMNDARVGVREEVAGCGRSSLFSVLPYFSRVQPYRMVSHVAYIQPQVEAVKRRQIECEVFLDFAVGQTDIRPEYMNNAAELDKVAGILEDVEGNGTFTVHSISVIGYASPEGTRSLNRQLAEGRARALTDYLLQRLDIPESMYHIVNGGENWDGLRFLVAQSDMPDKTGVLDIIDNIPEEINYSENTSRKQSLMSYKSGVPYRYLLRKYFPHLRNAVCRIDYEVQSFDVEQAKEVVRTRPQDLSLNEMYNVALACESGSKEFVELFEIAVSLYPDDPTANLNAAATALSRGDADAAEEYLGNIMSGSSVSRSPEYDNALGVMYMQKGDYDKAQTCLDRAAERGLEQARLNLEELARKRENVMAVESGLLTECIY